MTFLLDHDTPDDIAYSLQELGHQAVYLRDVLPIETEDSEILGYACKHAWIMVTCNRDDFLRLAKSEPHVGIIILIRKRRRASERAAIVRLLDKAGESGIANNINFA
jgi:predicted nuclease of predicted toxin-antitoxin system